ncbi:Glycosyl transferase family 2 [compost metagenome]
MANGEFVALLDNDDLLAPNALTEVIKAVNKNRIVDVIYSDEDKLLNEKRVFPFFKKKYNKNLLYYINFVCHLVVFRTSLVKDVNGFRTGYEGVQDWDLSLRIFRITDNIVHIPKVLYHWRISETSTAGGEQRKTYIKSAKKKMLSNIKKKGDS